MEKFKEKTPALITLSFSLFILVIIIAIHLIHLAWQTPKNQINEIQANLPEEKRLSPKEEIEIVNQQRNIFITHLINSIGTIATITGGVVLFLNFRVANKNAMISNKNHETTSLRLISERLAKAIDQLGNENIHIRIGGIYSLEKIAYDSPQDYWPIMEILSAFIRENSPIKEEIELQKISTDTQASLTVIGRCNPVTEEGIQMFEIRSSHNERLDLSRTNLTGANFYELKMVNINFSNAILCNSMAIKTDFENSNFYQTNLEGSKVNGANFRGTNLSKANVNKTDFHLANGHDTAMTDGIIGYINSN